VVASVRQYEVFQYDGNKMISPSTRKIFAVTVVFEQSIGCLVCAGPGISKTMSPESLGTFT